MIPLIFYKIGNQGDGAVRVQHDAGLSVHNPEGTAFPLQGRVHGLLIKFLTLVVYIICDQLAIQRPGQLIILVLMLQILTVLVTPDDIAGLAQLYGFLQNLVFIGADQSQLAQGRGQLIVADMQGQRLFAHLIHIAVQGVQRFGPGHAGQVDAVHIDAAVNG